MTERPMSRHHQAIVWFLIGLLSGLIVLAVATRMAGASDDEKSSEKGPKKYPSIGMTIKLEMSKKILAALAQEDFETLENSAKAMRALNHIESFVQRKTPGYQVQLKVFQFSTDELVRNAEERNTDGATLAFTQMTISCVNCHKQLRKD